MTNITAESPADEIAATIAATAFLTAAEYSNDPDAASRPFDPAAYCDAYDTSFSNMTADDLAAERARPLRDRLIDALADEIHDMLHDANLDSYIPDPPADDDAFAALSDCIDNDDRIIISLLADILLAR